MAGLGHSEVKKAFEDQEIVPDCLDEAPNKILQVIQQIVPNSLRR